MREINWRSSWRSGTVLIVLPGAKSRVPPPAVVAGNRAQPISQELIALYEGTYLLEMGGGQAVPLRIFGKAGQLIAELGGRAVSPLLPGDAAHEFTVAIRPRDRIVFTVEDGRAEELIFFQAGRPIVGVKSR